VTNGRGELWQDLRHEAPTLVVNLACLYHHFHGRSNDALDGSGINLANGLSAAVPTGRQLTKSATLSVTYLNSRGFDQLLTINANAPLWEVPVEEFGVVVDVNLKGTFHLIRYFLPAMIARGQGVVVNFSSGWGRSTASEVAPYCATKWGVEGLTRALAEELPSGLAAVALNPGVVHTELLESCFGQSAKSYPGPERWAERATPFLLSLGPEHNGKSLTVPGF